MVDKAPSVGIDHSDSSTRKFENSTTRKRKHKRKKGKKRIIKLLSSSSEDLDNNDSSSCTIQSKQTNSISNGDQERWEANLNKYFVCRICSEKFSSREAIEEHINKHKNLQIEHKDIFNKSCLVLMEKFDEKPNLTNSDKSVVYSPNYILQNKQNPYYYLVYRSEHNDQRESDSKFTESEIISRKRRRDSSRSSSKTVDMNENCDIASSPPLLNNIPTINIEDSSDNGSDKSNKESETSIRSDLKTIQSIMETCYNRCAKKIDAERNKLEISKSKETISQHKLLSIGTKLINRGFNCTGILRYLEDNDLRVVWKEVNTFNASIDSSKYVRIATRMRENDIGDEKNVAWKYITEIVPEYISKNRINILSKVKTIKQAGIVKMNNVDNLPRISEVFSHHDLGISKTDSDNHPQKLLNPNPVSNPKQLPKKNNDNSNAKITKVFSAANKTTPSLAPKQIDGNNVRSMPILTPSVSLAPISENNNTTIVTTTSENNKTSSVPAEEVENSSSSFSPLLSTAGHRPPLIDATPPGENSVVNNEQQIQYPRIKVKPFSELMQTVESNIFGNNQSVLGPSTNSINMIWPNQNIPPNNQQNVPVPVNSTSNSANTASVTEEYIVLDTVEFPNTKTKSPFNYLKDLLSLHNITLLDSLSPLPLNALCLIKLQLKYVQDGCKPVSLYLSLFCTERTYCIKLRENQQRELCINSLSANWQWQLLKKYGDPEISQRVLETASKISDELRQCTKHLFTLINSIKHIK